MPHLLCARHRPPPTRSGGLCAKRHFHAAPPRRPLLTRTARQGRRQQQQGGPHGQLAAGFAEHTCPYPARARRASGCSIGRSSTGIRAGRERGEQQDRRREEGSLQARAVPGTTNKTAPFSPRRLAGPPCLPLPTMPLDYRAGMQSAGLGTAPWPADSSAASAAFRIRVARRRQQALSGSSCAVAPLLLSLCMLLVYATERHLRPGHCRPHFSVHCMFRGGVEHAGAKLAGPPPHRSRALEHARPPAARASATPGIRCACVGRSGYIPASKHGRVWLWSTREVGWRTWSRPRTECGRLAGGGRRGECPRGPPAPCGSPQWPQNDHPKAWASTGSAIWQSGQGGDPMQGPGWGQSCAPRPPPAGPATCI